MRNNMRDRITGKLYGYTLDLYLNSNLVLVGGNSGIGKSLVFSFLDNLSNYTKKDQIVCINNTYALKISRNNETEEEALLYKLNEALDKLIVIDNADSLLTAKLRNVIASDSRNSYLIFGRNVEGLWINEDKLADLINDKDKKEFRLYYKFKN